MNSRRQVSHFFVFARRVHPQLELCPLMRDAAITVRSVPHEHLQNQYVGPLGVFLSNRRTVQLLNVLPTKSDVRWPGVFEWQKDIK